MKDALRCPTLLAALFALSTVLSGQISGRSPRPIVGAIRWDAWHGQQGVPGRAVEASLGPEKWHYRLPFFARVVSDHEVSIDGASQEVMDREIAYASAAGIDYWAFVTYDENDPMSLGLKNYLASRHRQDVHFSLIVEYQRLGRPDHHREQFNQIVRMMAQPGYQKVLGGRPLFYLAFFGTDWGLTQWGGAVPFHNALDELRAASIQAGAGDPYIVLMSEDVPHVSQLRVESGADAVTAYATQSNEAEAPYSALAASAERFWNRCRAAGSSVVPIVMSGWDRRPRVERPVPWEKQIPGAGLEKFYETGTPLEIAAHLDRAFRWMADNPQSSPAKAALIYAWNENDEGGWLVPTLKDGAARLDAIRLVTGGPRIPATSRNSSRARPGAQRAQPVPQPKSAH
jgi:hypothetical protein